MVGRSIADIYITRGDILTEPRSAEVKVPLRSYIKVID